VACLYFVRTPYDLRTHDLEEHIEYTQFIVQNKKLPKPYQLWQSYHPPLYYLIASLFGDDLTRGDKAIHVNKSRLISIFFGLWTLFIILSLLRSLNITPPQQLLVALFIATIPKYIFVFSTYNNDSLAMFCSVAIVYYSYSLSLNWSKAKSIILLIATTAALYAKYTSIVCFISVCIVLLRKLFLLQLPTKNGVKTLLVLMISAALFLPYVIIHNYQNTHKLFPTNFDSKRFPTPTKHLNIKRIMRIPILQSNLHEWTDPWAHPDPSYQHKAKKSHDFWGYMLVTSLIGEYNFKYPSVNFYWFLYYIHFIIGFLSICFVLKGSSVVRYFAFCGLLGYVIQALLLLQVYARPCTMDFRYVCWLWLCWS
ncbi:MAG: glycosyltransferase family 39 protein, partial [Candidatus Melainabacteria bacterium]|nr:glycosyltransferase family 39 protein [Candidatus Melainabacteria bacterium]